ncbi:MAG: hypothetical protein IKT40_08725 [Bacilli bacterium]|nr:hypothetical protein [Bacilli bacterium]
MRKFGLKIFSLVIALVAAVVLTGCVLQQGTKIEFSQLPAGVYTTQTGSINLNEVTIKINNDELTLAEAKEKYNVTITGDSWTTYGDYTLVVILDGAAVSFKYAVRQEIVQVSYDTTWDGEGTEESPWLIQDEEELKGLAAVVNKKVNVAGLEANCAGKYFQLTNNIELAPGWEPIGAGNRKNNLNSNYFAGNFDGNNKVISGLTNIGYNPVEVAGDYEASGGIELINKGYVFGLFGIVFGATIENVIMEDVYTQEITLVIENKVVTFTLDSVGAIAGYIPQCVYGSTINSTTVAADKADVVTTFVNCKVLSGEINGYDACAGIVGRAYGNLKAVNCSNAANVSCTREGSGKCGGITAIASGTEYQVKEDGKTKTVQVSGNHEVYNCSNSGKILVEYARHVGGIVGLVNGLSFKESGNSNTGRLFGLDDKAGQLVEYSQSILGQYQNDKYEFENKANWFLQNKKYVG